MQEVYEFLQAYRAHALQKAISSPHGKWLRHAERYWGNSDLCKLPAKRRCGHASQSAWGFSFFAPYLSRCASGAHLSYSKCADFLQELPALLQLRTGAHHANRGGFSHLIKRIRQGG